MTQPIDTAYVDIVPVDKSLEKLQRDIDKIMKKIEREAEKDLKKLDKDFNYVLDQVDRHFAGMSIVAQENFNKIEKIADDSLDAVEADFNQSFRVINDHFIELGDESDRSFKRIRSRFLEPMAKGMSSLGGMMSDLGRALVQLVTGIGGAIGSNPLASLIILLIPPIIALSAALSQLIGLVGLLPAGLGVLLGAIIPVVVAFQNFGDAVSAIASGDVDKINEAMKKLSPSAQSVAREIGDLLPVLRRFQRIVQEGFFAPLVGDFSNVVRRVLPALERGFFSVSQAMGRMVSGFAELAAAPSTIQVIEETLASTSRIITTLSGPFQRFADVLLDTVHESLPFIERIATAFGKALDAFSAFIGKAVETGDFDKFIEDALTTVKELIDLTKALGGLLKTIFSGTEESGHNFLQTLTEWIKRLDEFFKSAEGQNTLMLLSKAVEFLGASILATTEIIKFFITGTRNTLLFLEKLGRGFVELVTKIKEWLSKLPGIVTEFIGGLPNKVEAFFTDMFNRALMAIGIGTGLILFAIQVLPQKIGEFFMSLPQRIYDIFVQIGPIIATAFQNAVDFAKNIVVNGFNSIIEFITSVPDRLKSLIPTFGGAGRNLIQSFMNGFRSVGAFIGDVAGDIVGAVKGFLNKAIDKINSGIAKVDAVLPGDLGRIPRLAEGAFVPRRPGGILANIGEGREDEWVLPQSKLEQMVNGGQGITFGPGSINLNFSGVVPTEREARDAGLAVGQGILDMISRRNMRAQVRAV